MSIARPGLTTLVYKLYNIYSLDNVLIKIFPSKTAAAKWLIVNESSVRRYVKSGNVFNGKYRLTTFLID